VSAHTKSRLLTLDQARQAMAELVLVATELARKQARAQAKIAAAQAALEESTRDERAALAALEAELALFTQTNPALFKNPKSLKHAGATIGWERTTEIAFTDPEDFVAAMIEGEIDRAHAQDDAERADRLGACLKTTTKVLKKPVEEAILNGVIVPGCLRRETDQVFVRLDKKLLKAAAEDAAPRAEGGAA
jgi:hypothetical protein